MAKKITIRGFIGWDENATPEFLQRELAAANGEEIDLEFSSGGGLVFAGLEMANMVRNYSGRVVARVTGLAASMSSYIPMMADEMIVEDNAVFMIHNVSTFAWGDFRDLAKASKHIQGLRDILAKAYVAKTGKSLADIQGLMDDESFFYGDEIVEAGFADSVIKVSDDGDDKDTAVILAKEEIENIIGKMKNDEQAVKADWQKAAASYFKIEKPLEKQQAAKTTPPHEREKTEEATKMTLQEFLAANPAEKAAHELLIASARTEGETAGKEKMQATIKEVSPFIGNASYPAVIGETALKVLNGDDSMVTLKASVAAVDAVNQQREESDATDETDETGETKGEAPDKIKKTGEEGMISTPEEVTAAAKLIKEG